MRTHRATGFTLVELLVAVLITAILFAMGYGALSQVLTGRKEIEEQTARLTALQQTFRVIEQDIELMQPRPLRDPLGNGYLNPLVADQNALTTGGGAGAGAGAGTGTGAPGGVAAPSGMVQVSFTRGSWANPAGLPRSELQRVSYLVRDGKLIRQHLPILDAPAATAFEERELLDQVEVLSFRFMDDSLTWSSVWPTPTMQRLPLALLLRARPVAVEVTLKLKDYGLVTRIIEVAG